MEIRQLEYIVAVADHGGFTKAATARHVSQPSLSHGVRTLEDELGLQLFIRLGRAVQPTAAGEQVIDAARRVLRDLADLAAVTRAAADLVIGRLDLVALPTLAVDPLADLLGSFRTRYPGVSIRVSEPEDTASVDQQVGSGRAELGLTDLLTASTGLTRIELFHQDIVAVCPPGTDIAPGLLSHADFAAMPLIVTPPGTSTRRLLDRVVSRSTIEPNIVVELSHREAILPLVLAGGGISLLPSSMALIAEAQGAVVRKLKPDLRRRVGIIHRRGPLSPAASAMITLAKDQSRRMGAHPRRSD